VKTSLPVFPARSGSIREIFSCRCVSRCGQTIRRIRRYIDRIDIQVRRPLGGFRFVSRRIGRRDVKESGPIDTLSAGRQQRGASLRFINIVIGAQKSVCHTQGSYVLPSPRWQVLLLCFPPPFVRSPAPSCTIVHPPPATVPSSPSMLRVPFSFLSLSLSLCLCPLSDRPFAPL